MRRRFTTPSNVAIAIAMLSLSAIPASAQVRQAPTTVTKWAPTRTPDGQPDLQGVWRFATVTPLERPQELAGKAFMTKEEAEAFAKAAVARGNADPKDGEVENRVVPYNEFWWDRGTDVVGTRRTSLVVDPADGKLPPLTPAAQENVKQVQARRDRGAIGPEDRSLQERCIVGFNAGPPMLPAGYNQNVQLFQGPGYVVILNEMVHNARVVPLENVNDNHPRLNESIRQLSGDSRGRWDGNTLIVETTNFRAMPEWPRVAGGISEQLNLTERFTRVDEGTLLYEFTVNDPKTFTRPWRAEVPMTRIDEKIYEYACHEGNYGMTNLLSGARAEERAADLAAGRAGQ